MAEDMAQVPGYTITNAFSNGDDDGPESALKMSIYPGDLTLTNTEETFCHFFGLSREGSHIRFTYFDSEFDEYVNAKTVSDISNKKVRVYVTRATPSVQQQPTNSQVEVFSCFEGSSVVDDRAYFEYESVSTPPICALSANARAFELAPMCEEMPVHEETPPPQFMVAPEEVVSQQDVVESKKFDIVSALTEDVETMSIPDLVQRRKYQWDTNEKFGVRQVEVELKRRGIVCYDKIQKWFCYGDKTSGDLPGELPTYGGPIKAHWDRSKFNDISDKIFERIRLRLVQDFKSADNLRRELSGMGVEIDDRKDSQSWTLKNSEMWGYTSSSYWKVYSQSSETFGKLSGGTFRMNSGGGSRGKRRGGYRIK